MTMDTIRIALTQMGYQEAMPGSWLKPVGYSMFTFHEGQARWGCYFKAANGSGILAWATQLLPEPDPERPYLRWLKEQEAWSSNINVGSRASSFELDGLSAIL